LHATQKKATKASRKWNLKQKNILNMKNKFILGLFNKDMYFFGWCFLGPKFQWVVLRNAFLMLKNIDGYRFLIFSQLSRCFLLRHFS